MGLNNTNAKTHYLSIQGGKIAQRVQEATAFTRTRTLETGKVIHELLYDNAEGILSAITTREGTYGKELHITLKDDGGTYVLQVKLSSGAASSFLRALPNVNLTAPLMIIPKTQDKDGVKRTSIILSQNNAGVKWAFTKDAPGDLPAMKQIKVKGVAQWDDSEQLEYFEKMILDINNKLSAIVPPVENAEATHDLPF
jgi:hypothetical protein